MHVSQVNCGCSVSGAGGLQSEMIMGCDGGVPVIRWIVKLDGNPTGVIYHTNSAGVAVVPLAWQIGDCGIIGDWELLEVELIDDVVGNASGLLIPYSELYTVARDGVRTLISILDNSGATYIPVGTRRIPSELGVPAMTGANQIVIDGTTWTPSPMVVIFSYVVLAVANPLTPPTYKGSNNIPVPMFIGESGSFEVIDGTTNFSNSNIVITAQSGDRIKISYSEVVI